MTPKRGIYLVGFSGAGKSAIAQLIAQKLGWPAYDLDDLIAQRAGLPIPSIFEREGETGFRLRETEALRAISGSGAFVLATGGGAFLSSGNRELMAGKGWTICLEGRPQTLLARIQRQLHDADPKAIRPLLEAADPLDKIRTLKSARQSAYALADWTIHTDRLTADQVADEAIRAAQLLETTPDPAVD